MLFIFVPLCVTGRPENCSILNAVSYNSSSLTLNVTCFNGNSPITGYLLYFRKTSSSEWKNLTTTAENNNVLIAEVVLRDLDTFTQYDVQVKGENRHGSEDGSDSFSIMKTVKTAEGGLIQNITFNMLPLTLQQLQCLVLPFQSIFLK